MAENNHNVSGDNPDMEEKKQMMLENEATMMRNVFIMRSRILSIQVKVAMDKLKAVESLDGIVDTTYDTKTYRKRAEKAFSCKKYEEADRHILEAEQLYSKMASTLFPAKAKIDEKPCEEYLSTKRNKSSSNHAGVTVVGNKEDILRCIDIAKKAFAKNELEKAKKWATRSQRIFYTNDAKELLAEIESTIAARDVSYEPQSMNLEAGLDLHEDKSAVDPNIEQQYAMTHQKPQAKCNENVEGATICINNANKSFMIGDLDKAEHFLLKAKRMDSSIDVEQYLRQVRDARAKNAQSTDCAAQEKGSHESKRPRTEQINLCMDEANTYLQVAENAFNDKNYERALVFLDKSEALYTSEHASNLRKKVQNKITKSKQSVAENCLSLVTESKPSDSHKKQVLKNDLNASENNMPKKEQSKPPNVEAAVPDSSTERPIIEKLKDVHAEGADTCIGAAEKAYYDRDLVKAERLYPSDRAKKALPTVIISVEENKSLDSEKLKCKDNVRVLGNTRDDYDINKVQKLIKSGKDNKQIRKFYSAKIAFDKAKQLQPNDKSIDEMLIDTQNKIVKRNAKFSPESTEDTSMGIQNTQNVLTNTKTYTDWAWDAYNLGDIENAESYLKLTELNSTEHSRHLLVKILRVKHAVENNKSDDDNTNTFMVVNYSKEKDLNLSSDKMDGYLRSAEEAFIKGKFKKARKYLEKPEIRSTPYVTELKLKVKKAFEQNCSWIQRVFGIVCGKKSISFFLFFSFLSLALSCYSYFVK